MQETVLYLCGVLILLLGLAVSIGLHELGHLLPAKLFKVKVLRYMIGFGPTLWSTKKGDTQYGVKAIPLGGYIAMVGMYPPKKATVTNKKELFGKILEDTRKISNEGRVSGEKTKAFYELPVYQKIIVMLGGPIMNLVLAVVFMAVVVSGLGVQQASKTVAVVSECLIPAGQETTECTPEMEKAPAAAAGLLPGDEIIAINGVEMTAWEELQNTVSQSFSVPLEFEVLRDGANETLTIIPAGNERFVYDSLGRVEKDAKGAPKIETVGMIGVVPATETVKLPITEAPVYVADNIKAVGDIILHMPERVAGVWNAAFGSGERDLDSPLSVVGAGRIAGEVLSNDATAVADKVSAMFGILASLNIALFVFNLVPLLPLDGGHILGALYEGAKRLLWRILGKKDPGPIDTAKMFPVTIAVAAVLISLTILFVYADLVKPIKIFN